MSSLAVPQPTTPAPARAIPRRQITWRGRARPGPDGRRRVRLWAPVAVLWVLYLPIALLIALPVLTITSRRTGLNPFAVLAGVGALLAALSGTSVEVDSAAATVLIKFV